MKRKSIIILLILCLVLAMTTACGGGGTDKNNSAAQNKPPASSEKKSETIPFTDSLGREVEIPSEIKKIAASGPLAQIVLFSLAPEMLVGLAIEWDAAAQEYLDEDYYNLPLLGQFYGGKGELNMEEVAAVGPEVIIDIGEPKGTAKEDLDGLMEQIGIPTVHITATTETMAEAYRTLGTLLNKKEEAETLSLYCEEIYGKTQDILKTVGEDNKTSLLYCLGDRGLNVVAKDSFHSEAIDLIADNQAVVEEPSSKGTGNEVDMEQLLLWDPQVIVFAPESYYDDAGSDPLWQELQAIKNGSYYEVPYGPYNWLGFPPSVNRYMGMVWLTQLLYPEAAKYDLYEETARYYDLFYHSRLTREQFDALTANSL